jgi:hypothetical protein
LITVKAVFEAATTAPIPTATAHTCANSPSRLPATVIRARRRPSDSDRLTMNRTLGPGKRMTSSATGERQHPAQVHQSIIIGPTQLAWMTLITAWGGAVKEAAVEEPLQTRRKGWCPGSA